MRRKLYFKIALIAIFFCSKKIYSQVFIPSNKEEILKSIDVAYDTQVSLLDGKYKSKIKKEYKKRKAFIKSTLLDSTFIFDDTYKTFVSNIVEEIRKKNPSIKKYKETIFINRHLEPNAACFGNHSFMFNLGLFQLLENEDEFAFIVCHEMAHQYLDHVNKGIRKRIETVNSKEYKRKIRDTRLTIYGRGKAARNLLKELNYGFLKKSRKREYEADSLGLVFFSNTKYNLKSAYDALEKLKKFDDGVFASKIKIDSLLNFSEFKFKKYWLEEEETMFDIEERADDYELNKDSLKTHPDIENRMKKVLDEIGSKSKTTKQFSLTEMKTHAMKDQINSLLHFNQLDLVFYLLMKKLQEGEQTEFVILKLAEAFQKSYVLKSNHTFGKKIPQASPFSREDNLNSIRTFLHNLEIRDVRRMGYHFCKQYETQNKSKEFAVIKEFFNNLNK
ncbi:M48 family metalloprotease [Tenacibaculum amylolyticum]|uniref:M48 family metalloprotease n=1 Tax=Tenacibaculum amylolyticum TaxID=104269 RepID=UPI0038B50B56